MNQQKFIQQVAAALLCAATLYTTSCKKEPKGSYTVKGQFLDSCGGKALAYRALVVRYNEGKGFNPDRHDSVGVGQTDINGNFEIVCKNWGEGEITIYTPTTFSGNDYIRRYNVTKEEGKIYDFNTVASYSIFQATLKITPKGTFAPTDTLYVGNKFYYPIPTTTFTDYFILYGEYSANLNYYNPNFRVETANIGWGIGAANKTKNGKSINYSICGSPEQVAEITVEK